jgi:2-phospho-L-lactate/phosphoenolpyruvate guanylyltransferase
MELVRAVLLPVKDLGNAKKRLAALLNSEQRFALANAMLADTVRALQSVRLAQKIFVVTNYPPAILMALNNGWEVIREDQQVSESVSVDAASRHCASLGVTSLLRLPLDVPLAQAADVDELLAIKCADPAVVMVPSRDGTGTNALLRTPPHLFPSHFGTGSFARHIAEAERLGAKLFLRRNPRLEMDVDDEADLIALLQHDLQGTETGVWLEQSGTAARLRASTTRTPSSIAAVMDA